MRRHPWLGLLLVTLWMSHSWAQDAETKPKKDFFGQGSFGPYDARGDAFGSGFVLGNRYGWFFHPNLHVGIDFDWYHAAEDTAVLQGTNRVVYEARFDYFPILGYVQIESGAGSRFIPYAGAGVGYQLAFVEGANFETEIFDAWGWGGWAGLGFRLSIQGVATPVALGMEAFYHSAEVSRMADTPVTGVRTREYVDAGGIGARIMFRFRLPEGK